MTRGEWEELADPERGVLERPVSQRAWGIPAYLELDGDRLMWRHLQGQRWPEPGQPGPKMLEDFFQLAEAQPARVLGYARRWGILTLCEHGCPASHNPPPPVPVPGGRGWCTPLQGADGSYWEPVEAWRYYARKLRALANIGAQLNANQLGKPEDWGRVFPEEVEQGKPVPWWRPSVEGERAFLGMILNQLTRLSDVRLDFQWDWGQAAPEFRLAGGGLFAALVLQLVTAIARSDGWAYCAGCGTYFAPKSRRPGGRRAYCDDCQVRRVPQRDAARDYRARKRPKK